MWSIYHLKQSKLGVDKVKIPGWVTNFWITVSWGTVECEWCIALFFLRACITYKQAVARVSVYPSFSFFLLCVESHTIPYFLFLAYSRQRARAATHFFFFFLRESSRRKEKQVFWERIRWTYHLQGKVENNEIISSDFLGGRNLIPTPCPIYQSIRWLGRYFQIFSSAQSITFRAFFLRRWKMDASKVRE